MAGPSGDVQLPGGTSATSSSGQHTSQFGARSKPTPTPSRDSERTARARSITPQSSLGSRSPHPCLHRRTTRAGSNAFVGRTKCLECGKVIHERRKEHYSPIRVISENEENNMENQSNAGGPASGSQRPEKPTDEEIQDFEDYKAFRNWQRSKAAHGKK